MKFSKNDTVGMEGVPLYIDTINVNAGWNMIGSITEPVSKYEIIAQPPGIITSDYYYYEGGYQTRDTIKPARAYWIKTNSAGSIILSSGGKQIFVTDARNEKLPVEDFNILSMMQKDFSKFYISQRT